MDFRKANDRINSSEYWLAQITQKYSSNDKEFDFFTEAFLVASFSIVDAVNYDFLDEGNFGIEVNKFEKIIKNSEILKIFEKLVNDNGNQIITFFEKRKAQFKILLENDLACYFMTLRNLVVHSNLIDFYDNILTGTVVSSRHFKTEVFQRFLSLNDGGYLVLNNGGRLNIGSEEMTDFGYLKNFAENENRKNQLIIKLQSVEAKDLLKDYLDTLKQFVQNLN